MLRHPTAVRLGSRSRALLGGGSGGEQEDLIQIYIYIYEGEQAAARERARNARVQMSNGLGGAVLAAAARVQPSLAEWKCHELAQCAEATLMQADASCTLL